MDSRRAVWSPKRCVGPAQRDMDPRGPAPLMASPPRKQYCLLNPQRNCVGPTPYKGLRHTRRKKTITTHVQDWTSFDSRPSLSLLLRPVWTRVDPRGPAPHNWATSFVDGLAKNCVERVVPRHANNITSLTCKGPAQDVRRTRVNPRLHTNDTQGAAWTCKCTNTQKTTATHLQRWTSLWALSPSFNKVNSLQNGPARDPRGPAF